jgi:hypothetical protein
MWSPRLFCYYTVARLFHRRSFCRGRLDGAAEQPEKPPRMRVTNENGRPFQWNVPETIAGRGAIGLGKAGRHAVAPEVREADIPALMRWEPVLTVRARLRGKARAGVCNDMSVTAC